MSKPEVIIDQPGVYLFRAPAKVAAEINRELVVVFAIPTRKSCGIVFFDEQTETKQLGAMLDTLYSKMRASCGASVSEVGVKIFGLSHYDESVLRLLRYGLKEKGLTVLAEDLGRNSSRSLLIDCATGKVGVSYFADQVGLSQMFLSSGTYRRRASPSVGSSPVLVLSLNQVSRQLARQAVEENPGCKATCPPRVRDFLDRRIEKFPWDFVLLFENLAEIKKLEKWVKAVADLHPSVQICWVGAAPSKFKQLPFLSKLEPETIIEFKKELKEVFSSTRLPIQTSYVLPFRKGKR